MATVLAADGRQEVVPLDSDGCCPRPICEIDVCGLMCTMVGLLPNGPLWDRAKAEAVERFRNDDCNGVPCVQPDNSSCTSLVAYATYLARSLHDLIVNALWPSLRESDPRTAVESLDEWLDRLGWQDCFDTACRDTNLGPLSPYEVLGECGRSYCATTVPEPMASALKRGIVLALTRRNMRPILNLASLNWIIEPLGAQVAPTNVHALACCYTPQFIVSPVASRQIEAAPSRECRTGADPEFIHAGFQHACNSGHDVFPGVLAAQCIIASLIRQGSCCDGYAITYSC